MSVGPAATISDPYAFQANDDLRTCMDICEYQPDKPARLWHDGDGPAGEMSFSDLLDIINPLQHLPVISTIYRAITGDKPGLVSELVGGALYGGPAGLLSAGINAAVADVTGKNDGEMLASIADSVFGSGDDDAAATAKTAPPQIALAPDLVEPAAMTEAAPAASSAAPAVEHPAHPQAKPFSAFTAARAFPAFTAQPHPFPARPAAAAGLPEAAAGDAELRRITESVAAQQRAQLGMILTNMNAASPASSPKTGGAPADNSYMPPPSTGSLSPAAMQQALDRYQQAIQGYVPPAQDAVSP